MKTYIGEKKSDEKDDEEEGKVPKSPIKILRRWCESLRALIEAINLSLECCLALTVICWKELWPNKKKNFIQ